LDQIDMAFDWLKHAFAIEPEEPLEPTEAQKVVVDRLCRHVVERGLAAPALVFLESVRPLNYVTSQTLQFFAPALSAVADAQACRDVADFLEHRGSIDYLCRRIEELSKNAECGMRNGSNAECRMRNAE
jgi:hypothetical protein